MSEERETRSLGFSWDDSSWFDSLREANAGPAPQRVGRFRVFEEVGRGGQGVVYRAEDIDSGRQVALKRLHRRFAEIHVESSAESSAQAPVIREVSSAKHLQHPGLVGVDDVEIHQGVAFLVMEWVDGLPLTEWGRGKSSREIVEVTLKVALALLHAHQRGVIHRDLKPSNILVDSGGEPHVLDFGLAKDLSTSAPLSSVSTTGAFHGTLAYAAPEQVLGPKGDFDARSDLYALGSLLYEMLTGVRPYELEGSLANVLHTILTAVPSPPSSHSESLDRALDAVVLKALAKDPVDRYRSIDAFAEDLERYLHGEPVQARAPGSWQLLRRLVHRHPVTTAIVGTLVVAVVGLSATMSVLWFRSVRATERTEWMQSVLASTLSDRWVTASVDESRAADILTSASDQLTKELGREPELEYQVRNRLAGRFADLHMWEESSREATRAMDLQLRLGTELDSEYTVSLHRKGFADAVLGDERGAKLLQNAIVHHRGLVGENHADMAYLHGRIGYVYGLVSEPADTLQAQVHFERAVSILAALPPDSLAMGVSVWHGYGDFLSRMEQPAAALDAYTRALSLYDRQSEDGSIARLICLEMIARIQSSFGLWEEAETSFQECIDSRNGRLDNRVPACEALLGNTFFHREDYESALSHYHEAIAKRLERLGQLHANERPRLIAAAARIRSRGLEVEDVPSLWNLLSEVSPNIVPLFRYTGGQIAAAHRGAGSAERASEIEEALERMQSQPGIQSSRTRL